MKVRSEFIGRGKYDILPEATGVDGLLSGEINVGHDYCPPASTRTRSSHRAMPLR